MFCSINILAIKKVSQNIAAMQGLVIPTVAHNVLLVPLIWGYAGYVE